MAEEQVGDDDAFLYGEDAEQEEGNRGVEVVEAANGGGASEESRPVRCKLFFTMKCKSSFIYIPLFICPKYDGCNTLNESIHRFPQ